MKVPVRSPVQSEGYAKAARVGQEGDQSLPPSCSLATALSGRLPE